MKLKAKIKNKYLKEILEGGKKIEYRQIEGITLIDEDGNEHNFGVADIRCLRQSEIHLLKKRYNSHSVDCKNINTVKLIFNYARLELAWGR